MANTPDKAHRIRRQLFELHKPERDRTPVLWLCFVVMFAAILLRLFYLQVVREPYYVALAEGQRTLSKQLHAERGEVLVRDVNTGEEFPLAANQELEFVYADPQLIEDVDGFVAAIAGPLALDQAAQDELKPRLQDKNDRYEPIARKVEPAAWEKLDALDLPGLAAEPESWRIYPEKTMAGQVAGYVGFSEDGSNLVGSYGIEGYFNDLLAGVSGSYTAERDAKGRRIVNADQEHAPAHDGSDVVLTLDRTIQHMAQQTLEKGCKRFAAKYCDVVVMDPSNGDVLAMASAPGFDPNEYDEVKDLQRFKNTAIGDTYEPGSTFKTLTMAAAVDAGLVTPDTVFVDNGCRKVDVFQICNFDKKGPGSGTATYALERSSNVIMSQIAEKLGRENFERYLHDFGLDALTGITLEGEAEVSVPPAEDWPETQLATIGFGQGISTTPLHLVMAQAAIANGGHLMEPHIVKEVRHADGRVEKIEPKEVATPIKPSTSLTVTAMMVSAIDHGVAELAQVDGYTVAGKTGTAQVARTDGKGYDGSTWVASFIGFGPVPDPKFITLIRLYDPATSIHGADTAAPMFSELAPQIMGYLHVGPDRETKGDE